MVYDFEELDLNCAIGRINDLLIQEENLTIERQFNDFVDNVLPNKVVEKDDELYLDFQKLMNDFEDIENYKTHNYEEILNSSFLNKIISYKSNAREKELRRLTIKLSDFIKSLGHNYENNHPKDYFANQLKHIAEIINPKENKSSKESMNDAWRREMFLELVKRFK